MLHSNEIEIQPTAKVTFKSFLCCALRRHQASWGTNKSNDPNDPESRTETPTTTTNTLPNNTGLLEAQQKGIRKGQIHHFQHLYPCWHKQSEIEFQWHSKESRCDACIVWFVLICHPSWSLNSASFWFLKKVGFIRTKRETGLSENTARIRQFWKKSKLFKL